MSSAEQPADQHSVGRLVVALGLACFSSTLSMRVVDPLVPLIASDLSRSIVEVALLTSVFTLSYAGGQPFLGPIADSFGKVHVIVGCLLILALTSLGAAFAPDFLTLSIARGLSGVFAGGVIPIAMAAVGDRVDMAHRQVALSRLLIALTTGQVAGSLISGLLGAAAGWRSVFLFGVVSSSLSAICVFLLLKPRRNAERTPFRLAVAKERYGDIFANPKAIPLFALTISEGMCLFGVMPYVADTLQHRGAASAAEAGLALAPFGLGGLFYAFLAPWLVRTLGPRLMTLLGGVLVASALMVFALPLHWSTAPVVFGVCGLGFYFIHTSFQTQATELSSESRGSAVALFACSMFIGTAMGPPVFGAILHGFGLTAALASQSVAVLVIGAIAGTVLNLPKSQRPR